MSNHYVEKVPLNVRSSAPKQPASRARKRQMDSRNLKFRDLRELMKQRLARGTGLSVSSDPNLQSALNGFLRERNMTDDSVIGSVLRSTYYDNLKAHLTALKAEGRSPSYIANRRHLLAQWRSTVIECDRHCAVQLKQAAPFQRALLDIFEANITRKGLARATGLPLATLKRWLDGRLPNARSAVFVPRIETFLGLPAGTLADLLPLRTASERNNAEFEPIAYRERLKSRAKLRYSIKTPSASLRNEWTAFVRYKVDELDEVDEEDENYCDDGDGPGLKRSAGGRWSSTASPVVRQRATNWHSFHNGRYVPSAGVKWTMVAMFLGWLQLSEAEGGKGLCESEAMTLAHFSRKAFIGDYVDWQLQRSSGIAHSGITSFLMFASSLCNPKTGYLTQSWARFSSQSGVNSAETWGARCRQAFQSFRRRRDALADDAAPSRSSLEPIKHVLALQNPLQAIADMLVRMDAVKPNTGGEAEAVWARDRLMVKLLASNPIRDKNLRMMTFRADGSGHLHRGDDRGWYIRIPRRELKNFRGAARERDYHMQVRPEVWRDIEEYLKVYRPMLLAGSSDYVFLTTRGGAAAGEATLRRRFEMLTRKYLYGCPGVGPHSMRHIVATSILKASPNDWHAAAWALHDREETVKRHYAHLARHDADKWLSKAMDEPFRRMQ